MKRIITCCIVALSLCLFLAPIASAFNIPTFSANDYSQPYGGGGSGHTYVPPPLKENDAERQQDQLDSKLRYGNLDVVRAALDEGANVNATDNAGRTALMQAAEVINSDAIDVMRLLIENGANVNATDKDGKTALMEAAKNGFLDKMQLLIANGADVNARDNRGSTVLMQNAAHPDPLGFKQRNANFVQFLIENGADVNVRDNSGKTVLMYAADRADYGPRILTIGSGGVSLQQNFGGSFTGNISFHSISKIINPEFKNSAAFVVALLLDAGANVNAKDIEGKTALMYAAYNGNEDAVWMLLDAGADAHLLDNSGWSALKWAIYNNKIDVVPLFDEVEARLASNSTASNPENKLIDAAGNGDINSVKALLNNGANIEMKNEYGYTALMYASYYGHADVVRILLEKGANMEAKDSYGRTALLIADQSGHADIVKILKNAGAK